MPRCYVCHARALPVRLPFLEGLRWLCRAHGYAATIARLRELIA